MEYRKHEYRQCSKASLFESRGKKKKGERLKKRKEGGGIEKEKPEEVKGREAYSPVMQKRCLRIDYEIRYVPGNRSEPSASTEKGVQ